MMMMMMKGLRDCRWAIVGDCDLTLSRYACSNGDEGSPFDIGRGRLGDLPQRREDDIGFGSLQWCGVNVIDSEDEEYRDRYAGYMNGGEDDGLGCIVSR
jgi:hypothetical protein